MAGAIRVATHIRDGKVVGSFIRKRPAYTGGFINGMGARQTFSYGRGSGSVPYANAKRIYTHVGRRASAARFRTPMEVTMSVSRGRGTVQSVYGGTYKVREAHHVFIRKAMAGGKEQTRHMQATPSSARRIQRLAKAISTGNSSFTLR